MKTFCDFITSQVKNCLLKDIFEKSYIFIFSKVLHLLASQRKLNVETERSIKVRISTRVEYNLFEFTIFEAPFHLEMWTVRLPFVP